MRTPLTPATEEVSVEEKNYGCTIMGILNLTPDSFSGSRTLDVEEARKEGIRLVHEGADIVDIGGESTRPGAVAVNAEDQLRRILPAVRAISQEKIFVSVDTSSAKVAQETLAGGAQMINDVSGGRRDPHLFAEVAQAQAWLVIGHWQGAVTGDHNFQAGGTSVSKVAQDLCYSAQEAQRAGVARERIILDPGLGFGKNSAENWALLRGLDRLLDMGYPLLVGASRKRFLSQGGPLVDEEEFAWRDAATAAVTTYAVSQGAWGVRVHCPRSSKAAAWVGLSLRRT